MIGVGAENGIGLTPKEATLLRFLQGHIAATGGFAPTIPEMLTGLGWKSRGMLCSRLEALTRKGRIRRLRYKQQAIEILRPLETVVSIRGQLYRFIPSDRLAAGRQEGRG